MLADLLAYGALSGVAHSIYFYRRLRDRERRALLLESTLARTRLNALRAQLQPHFIFNSLNAIASLLRRDPALAETTLLSLSDLIRLALSQSEKQEVQLRDELQFVDRYLNLQQTRFRDKLKVEQQIDPETLDCFVPTLLLQPLVENAIRHGIEPSDFPGVVRLTANRLDNTLVLTVEDNGVGLSRQTFASNEPHATLPDPALNSTILSHSPIGRNGTGIGLPNLSERLRALYGDTARFQLQENTHGGGVTVRVELPWHATPHTHPQDHPAFS